MSTLTPTTDNLKLVSVVDRIVCLNSGLRDFWLSSHGWAPTDAAELLSRSRLDWQVSLSVTLWRWIETPPADESAATQILGYANVGSLVEGTMKLFLGVWYNDYKEDAEAISKKGAVQDPDGITLEPLRQFFRKNIWDATPADDWDPWIQRIQNRRNAIHAFKDREIGTHQELTTDIRNYLRFVRRVNSQLPYPDDRNMPVESHDPTDSCLLDWNAPAV